MSKNINLKIARARKDMTQKELAEQIGVSRQTINAIEKGGIQSHHQAVPKNLLGTRLPIGRSVLGGEREWRIK